MQSANDPALNDAVTAPARVPIGAMRADWARDGRFAHPVSDLSPVIDSVTVERSITSDLPAECSLVEGHAAAALTATVAGTRPGDPRDIARMISPYRPDTMLSAAASIDAPIEVDLGLVTHTGPNLVRQFTGTTRTVRVAASTRTVTIDALDPADRVRAAVTLPVGACDESVFRIIARYFYQDRINTQWVLDYVLRRNGIFLSPPPRKDCIWAMTCHGGLHPDVGSYRRFWSFEKARADVPEFVPGRYGLAANGSPEIHSGILSRTAGRGFRFGTPGVGHVVDFWIKAGGSNTFHRYFNSLGYGVILNVNATLTRFVDGANVELAITTTGQLQARVFYDSPTPTGRTLVALLNGPVITGPAAWHSVGLWVAYDAAAKRITSRWHLDGVTTTVVTTPGDVVALAQHHRGEVALRTCLPMQCLQIAEAPAPPADWGVPHVSQCDLDVGLNWFTGLPDIVGADSWTVIKDAVAAEYGLIMFTEHGRFRFLNRDTARTPAAPIKNITAATDLSELDIAATVDAVRNEITIRTATRLEREGYTTVYATKTVEELETPANTTRTFTIQLDRRRRVVEDMYHIAKASWTADKQLGFVAVNASTGAEVTNIYVTVAATDGDHSAIVTVENPNTFTIRFAVGSQPAFRVAGYPITEEPERTTTATDPTSITTYGRRCLDLPNNPFRQDTTPAAAITTSLLADLAQPAPVLADLPVVGDPRVQLADVVTINDPDGLGGPITGSVVALRRTLSNTDGLADSITVRTRRT